MRRRLYVASLAFSSLWAQAGAQRRAEGVFRGPAGGSRCGHILASFRRAPGALAVVSTPCARAPAERPRRCQLCVAALFAPFSPPPLATVHPTFRPPSPPSLPPLLPRELSHVSRIGVLCTDGTPIYLCTHTRLKRAHTPHVRGRWRAVRDSRRGRCELPRLRGPRCPELSRSRYSFTQSHKERARSTGHSAYLCIRQASAPCCAHRRFLMFRPRAWCTHKSGSLALPPVAQRELALSLAQRLGKHHFGSPTSPPRAHTVI